MGGFIRGAFCGSRAVVLASATATLLSVSASGLAQPRPAAPLVPVVTALKGDDLDASIGPPVTAAFAPLQLSLTSGLFSQAGAFSGCASRGDASGNSLNGFATQYHSFIRLVPRLVLHGYSMMGCSVDAGMGGGLTYAVPLRKSLWLVPSAGIYVLPNSTGGGAAAPVTTAARVDLVKQLGWGGTLSFGLGGRFDSGRFEALHFGGSF